VKYRKPCALLFFSEYSNSKQSAIGFLTPNGLKSEAQHEIGDAYQAS
jgi:hypothetical protein